MTGRQRAALLAGASAAFLAARQPARAEGPPPPLSARFVLESVDGPHKDISTGTVHLQPGMNACVLVETPVKQELRLGLKELVVYYPDRDLALVGTVSPRQAPPLFEALVVALSDPTRTLPRGSTLLERKQTGAVLVTRWRVVKEEGEQAGEMRIEETREGASRIEVLDPARHPQRLFSFGDRLRFAGRSVPRTIEARYFTAAGAERRRESWTLSDLAPETGTTSCARIGPKTKVQELAW